MRQNAAGAARNRVHLDVLLAKHPLHFARVRCTETAFFVADFPTSGGNTEAAGEPDQAAGVLGGEDCELGGAAGAEGAAHSQLGEHAGIPKRLRRHEEGAQVKSVACYGRGLLH